jgi:hypothetical protein
VVIDSDKTPIHAAAHDELGEADKACRLCQLRALVTHTLRSLRPRVGQPELKIALGLAVPAVEGWYLCGRDRQVGEANWRNGQKAGKLPYAVEQLKRQVYGTDKPSIARETECAVREVQRVVQNLARLEAEFPDGFGALAHTIRAWQVESSEQSPT